MNHERLHRRISLAIIGMVVWVGLGCNVLTPKSRAVPAQEIPVVTQEVILQQVAPTEAGVVVVPTAVSPAEATLPPEAHGKIEQVEDLPEMPLSGLRLAPGGMVWVSGAQGIYQSDGKIWNWISGKPVLALLGSDDAERVWAVFEDGAAIGYYKDEGWTVFDQQAGWEPLPESEYLSPGLADGLQTDAQGRVWLATGSGELRRFDPQAARWATVTAQELGLPPSNPDYQGYFITSTARLNDGSLLAGLCAGEGESFVPVGVARLVKDQWQMMDSTQEDCVLDLETGADGTVWAGGFGALLEYCPGCTSWKRTALPAYERQQLVLAVDVDTQGEPWVKVARYGGASAYGELARYALTGGEWASIYGPGLFESTSLAFGEGVTYLEAGGVLYRLEGSEKKEIARFEPGGEYRMLVDGSGVVWVARLGDPDGGLWKYLP